MSAQQLHWAAWLPHRMSADGTIDATLASPSLYASKAHAFREEVAGRVWLLTYARPRALCGTRWPTDDEHLGRLGGPGEDAEPRGRCKRCERAAEEVKP